MSTTPLAIYVLWHPAAESAAPLASEVYRWFHASSDDLLRFGMGVPVFFRSQPCGESGGAPAPVRCEEAQLNIVVVLAEANLVADPQWTSYIDEIGHVPSVQVIPVSLHESAYRLPEVVRRLNYLRVDERDDPPLDPQAQLARRTARLLRQLTEVIGRQLAARLAPEPALHNRPPPPLTIFLSHAKRDGVDVAEALRSVIQNHGQVRAFLDDSDLPVGHAFASELERAAVSGSAAMIAIVSDAYAARPWCRREIALARTPRVDATGKRCWTIQPLLVVDSLKCAPTRNIPEFGNALLVRWAPDSALSIIDLLMLEVLLVGYHRLRAGAVPSAPGRHVISWTPDLPTLLALKQAARTTIREIVYPGHELPQPELAALRSALPGAELRTFENVERHAVSGRPLADRAVGLSAGYNEDLGRLGLGREHLEEITLRIARCAIEAGGRLVFGGMLGSSGLTETLLTLVRSLSGDDDNSEKQLAPPRILSYQRWPVLPTREQIAKDVGISEYVLIDTPLPSEQRLANDARVQSPERSREHAHALSAMRRAMTKGGSITSIGRPAPPLAARILVGGMRCGFNGFMPGIFEEALYALEERVPVYVIGGFGGGASLLARAILEGTMATEFHMDFHRANSARFRTLVRGLEMRDETRQAESLFERMHTALGAVHQDMGAGLNNGLDAAENRRLMQSDHVAEIIELLGLGFERRFAAEKR